MSTLVLATYNGAQLSFTDDGWFNATEAAAQFGKEPAQWARLPATVDYLQALERKYGKNTYLKTKRGQSGGTWLHPRLAVHFARWLDTDFAVWCDEKIDNLLRGKSDWRKVRFEAAATYNVMSAILQMTRLDDGKDTAPHHFQNEAKLVNWALAGKFEGIDRDKLSAEDLALLVHLEERNAVLMGRGLSYDQRKPVVKQYAIDWRIARTALIARAA